jgi:hypothetical protein
MGKIIGEATEIVLYPNNIKTKDEFHLSRSWNFFLTPLKNGKKFSPSLGLSLDYTFLCMPLQGQL